MAENITGASLDGIYERLHNAPNYHPLEAETFSDWSLEAGDLVTVKRGNTSYQSPVHNSKLVWKGTPQMTLSSTGNKERDAVSKVSRKKYARSGVGMSNDQSIRRSLFDAYTGLASYLEFTESRLYLAFSGMYDGLSSHFEITRSRMYVDFYGMYDGLSSTFEVTRSRMYVDFNGMYDGLSSQFEITRSRMYVDFYGVYDGLSSSFEVTRSRMYADFYGIYDGLSSTFEVTRSRMYVDFQGAYDGLSSTFEVTRSRMYVDFSGAYDGLSSTFEVTRSRMYVDFSGAYDGLSSAFEVTRSRMAVEFQGAYDGLSSAFEVTRSRMAVSFQGAYDGLSSAFEVTRSRMAAEFQGAYDGLSSSFEITRSRMAVSFQGAYDGLSSAFEITRSRMYTEFTNSYNGMSTYVEQTASGWATKLSGVVDANGNVTAASIATAINAQGQAGVSIKGKWIELDGQTIATSLYGEDVTVHDLTVQGDATFQDGVTASSIDVADGLISCERLSVGFSDYVVVDATVSGNTLTITKVNADTGQTSTITFNKAASTKVSGGWSSGVLTVSADDNGEDQYRIILNHDATKDVWDNNKKGITAYIDTQKYNGSGQQPTPLDDNVKSIWINTTTAWNTGWDQALGNMSVPTASIGSYIDGNYANLVVGKAKSDRTSGTTDTTYSLNINSSFRPSGSSSNIAVAEIKTSGNVVARKTIPLDTLTANSNNTYTPGSGYVGFKSVTVAVPTPDEYYIKEEWGTGNDSNKLQIYRSTSTSGTVTSVTHTITAGATLSYDSSTHRYTATGKAYIDNSERASTSDTTNQFQGYTDGWVAARNAVGSGYFPTSTPSTVPQSIYTSRPKTTVDGGYNNYQYYVTVDGDYAYIKYNSTSGNTVARVANTPASTAYSNGRAAATLTGSWSGGKVTVNNAYNSDRKWYSTIADVAGADLTVTPPVLSVAINAYNNGSSYKTYTGKTFKIGLSGALTTKTITANGRYTPSSSYLGFSAVQVSVPATDISLSGGWTNGRVSVQNSAGYTWYADISDTVGADCTLDGNVLYVRVNAFVNGSETKQYIGKTLIIGGVAPASGGGGSSANINVNGWNLVYDTASPYITSVPYLYKLRVNINGTWYESDTDYYAEEAYKNGWEAGWNAYYNDTYDWISNWDEGNNKYSAWIPKRTNSWGASGTYNFYASGGKGNASSSTCEKWFEYTIAGGGIAHSISIKGASGPFSTVNQMKGEIGVTDVTQIFTGFTLNSTNRGYYAFEVSCGTAKKWYYFRIQQ